jgi:hypothetical protein
MGLWAYASGSARADCADPPTLEDAIAGAESVFVGEVIAAGFESDQATLSVQWIWKGPDLNSQLTVSTPPAANGGVPGYRFREGSTYIVIIEQRTNPIVIGECSGTRVYRGDGEAIPADLQEATGRATGRVPGELAQQDEPDPRSEERTRAVWIGMLAALGMILVAIMAFQARSAGDEPGGKKRVRGFLSGGRSGGRQVSKLRRRRRRR